MDGEQAAFGLLWNILYFSQVIEIMAAALCQCPAHQAKRQQQHKRRS